MTRLLWIDALLVLAQAGSTEPYLLGAGDAAWVGRVRGLSALAYAAGVFLFVRTPMDTAALLWVAVATTAGIAFLHALRFRRRHGALALAPSLRAGRPLLAEASGFGLSSVMSLVYARVDVLLLRALRGEAAVGRYAACVRVTEATYAALTVLLGTLYPRSITEGRASPRRGTAQAQRALRLALGLALPAAVGAAVAGGPVVEWIAGPAYAGLDLPTALLGVVAIAGAFASIYGAFGLSAHGRSGHLLRATGLGALVNVGANLALIPWLGLVGAATATFLAQATVAWVAARRSRDVRRLAPWRALAPWVLPSLLMGLVVLGARFAGAPAPLLLGLGIIVYVAVVAARGTLRPSERAGLRRALRLG
jgi:O-antigen/teichoic acid export membrane protein